MRRPIPVAVTAGRVAYPTERHALAGLRREVTPHPERWPGRTARLFACWPGSHTGWDARPPESQHDYRLVGP